MDSPFLAYRDPLFGALFFALFLLTVSVATLVVSYLKKSSEKRLVERFLQGFEKINDENYLALFTERPSLRIAFELLAGAYLEKGEYEESVKIYLALLQSASVLEKKKRSMLLFALSRAYVKAGFLARAEKSLQNSLALSPRNADALRLWLALKEKMRDWDAVMDASAALEELGEMDDVQKATLESLYCVHAPKIQPEKRKAVLLKNSSVGRSAGRLALENFIQSSDLCAASVVVCSAGASSVIDILWFADKEALKVFAQNGSVLAQEVLSAKGEWVQLDTFEVLPLEILSKLKNEREGLDLEFSYRCARCGTLHLSYFYRCGICLCQDSCEVDSSIVKHTNIYESRAFT